MKTLFPIAAIFTNNHFNNTKELDTIYKGILKGSFFIFVYLIPILGITQVFHDNQGNAILYYKQDANIFYDYIGNCKFYLTRDNLGDINIYNFNGKHIGWYVNGTLRDHQGRIMASETNKLINITYKMSPMKPLEKSTPLRALEELGPIRPMWVEQFSAYSILNYGGSSNANAQQNAPYSTPNDYTALQQRQPYQLQVNEIAETVEALNKRHNELLANGYIFFEGNYYTQEQYRNIVILKNNRIEVFNNVIRQLKNTPITFKKEKYWILAKVADEKNYELVEVALQINENGEVERFYNKRNWGNLIKGSIVNTMAQKVVIKELYTDGGVWKGFKPAKNFPLWIVIEPNAKEYRGKERKDLNIYLGVQKW